MKYGKGSSGSSVPKGVKAGPMKSNVSNMVVSQVTGKSEGKSSAGATMGTACGSGSRPTPSHYKIQSSNPMSSQMIRPKNKIEGTGYKG